REIGVVQLDVVAEYAPSERVAIPRGDHHQYRREVLVLVRELLREIGERLESAATRALEARQDLTPPGGEELRVEREGAAGTALGVGGERDGVGVVAAVRLQDPDHLRRRQRIEADVL